MGVTIALVKAQSFSGEFALTADDAITTAIDEAVLHYESLVPHRGAKQKTVDKLTALHAAHLLHVGKKSEAGEEANDQPGPVKSASLDRVGSWTFGSANEGVQDKGGDGPLPDWASSPYGRRWRSLWKGLPSAVLALLPED